VVVKLPNGYKWSVEIGAVDAQAAKYKVLFSYIKVTARVVPRINIGGEHA